MSEDTLLQDITQKMVDDFRDKTEEQGKLYNGVVPQDILVNASVIAAITWMIICLTAAIKMKVVNTASIKKTIIKMIKDI